MAKNDTLFVDFENGNQGSIINLIGWLKDGLNGHSLDQIEKLIKDQNSYAIIGYALNYGFYNTLPDKKLSDQILGRGISVGATSSFFISGIVKIERGESAEGMRLIEYAVQRDYPPALFFLGKNHWNLNWKDFDKQYGLKCLMKASKLSYLPAKAMIYHIQSQPPYSKWVRFQSIIRLSIVSYSEKLLSRLYPLNKSASFFREF